MQSNSSSWFYGLAALFLAACLVFGIWLGQLFVPKPVIGVLRFEGIIEFASAQYLIEVMDKARHEGPCGSNSVCQNTEARQPFTFGD